MIHNKKYLQLSAVPLLSLSLVLSGCSDNTNDDNTQDNKGSISHEEPATIDYSSSSIQDDVVYPLDAITVSTNKDHLDSVSLTNVDTGKEVDGDIDGNSWHKTGVLGYGNTYRLVAQVENETLDKTITTPQPITADPVISPMDNQQVGVGQTVSIKFDVDIPDKKKIEDSIEVETNPGVDVDYRWVNNREVRLRPKDFWQPNTKINVKVNTYGTYLQDGIFGGNNVSTHFTISPESTITEIDDNTKTATVKKNGKIIKTFPISMGKDSTPTNNGIYILGDHNNSMIMDSNTFGVSSNSAEGYITDVDYATQMSYSGIYLHSAPWALGALGNYNQSHGCINASPEDAKWFLDNTSVGDIVIVKNSVGDTLPVGDGLGDWNIDFEHWNNS